MEWQKVNFLFYCLAYLFYGALTTAIGPMIPYFAIETGKPSTYFSFILFCRTFGYLSGGVLVKYLMNRFNIHLILSSAMFLGGIAFILSSLSITFVNLAVFLCLGSCSLSIMSITCNVATLRTFAGERQDLWLQVLHTLFGIGGFVGPFFVAFFGSKSYMVFGLLFSIASLLKVFLRDAQ